MSSQLSSASAPKIVASPATPVVAPRTVQLAPKRPRKPWLSILFVIALVAGAAWWVRQSTTRNIAANTVAVRTAVVTGGVVSNRLRLTGSTGAERFVSLVTPQLRGSRGERGRDSSTIQTANIAPNLVVQSNARSSVSGVSSNPASVGDGTSVSSTAGAGRGSGSQAFQNSTSRVGSSRPSSSAPSSPGGGTSNSTGNGGIGSTGGQLQGSGFPGGSSGGSGGGGGRSSDFGLVLQTSAKPGSLVRKGDTVGEFDRQYMMTRLEDYRVSAIQQEDAAKKLQAELVIAHKAYDQKLATAKADLDKARLDVKTTPVLSMIEGEKIRLAAEEADARYQQVLKEKKYVEIGYAAQLRNAQLDFETARLELKRAEANADRMIIKAPIAGLAVMQSIFRGAEFGQIQAGDQLYPGMVFMQIVDASSMVVNALVNQVDVEKMRIGQKAFVRVDAYPGLEVPAHVHSIGAITKQGGFRASFVKEVPVILKIDKMDPRIIPDLSVSADIVIESESAQAVAPLNSIFYDDAAKNHFAYVQNGEEWDRRVLQIGTSSNVSVSVRSGLKPGETVALEIPPAQNRENQAAIRSTFRTHPCVGRRDSLDA